MIRTRPAQLIFAVTALSCYSENELSWSGPTNDTVRIIVGTEIPTVTPSK